MVLNVKLLILMKCGSHLKPDLFVLTFLSGISPSTAAQVVHSAGRRFIVSPVPESRLKEQFFGASSANTSMGDESSPGQRIVCFISCLVSQSNTFDTALK